MAVEETRSDPTEPPRGSSGQAEGEDVVWQEGTCWLVVLGVVVALTWLWGQDRLTSLQFALGLLFVLALGAGAISTWGSGLGWFLSALLAGCAVVTVYLVFAGEERLFRLQLRSELKVLRRRIRECPTDPDTFVSLGETLQRLRRYPEALRNYEQAAALEPGNRDYRQKVKQLQHIIEAIAAGVRACPACNAAICGGEVACPKCGMVVDEYLYVAYRFGRGQYLLVAGTALGALLVVFALGITVGWKPKWLIGALLGAVFFFLALVVMRKGRRAGGRG